MADVFKQVRKIKLNEDRFMKGEPIERRDAEQGGQRRSNGKGRCIMIQMYNVSRSVPLHDGNIVRVFLRVAVRIAS